MNAVRDMIPNSGYMGGTSRKTTLGVVNFLFPLLLEILSRSKTSIFHSYGVGFAVIFPTRPSTRNSESSSDSYGQNTGHVASWQWEPMPLPLIPKIGDAS